MIFFQSIRWRVQAWHSLLLVCLVTAFGVFFYFHEKQQLITSIDHELQRRLPLLFPRFSSDPPSPFPERHSLIPETANEGTSKEASSSQKEEHHSTRVKGAVERAFTDPRMFYAVWLHDQEEPILSPTAPRAIQFIPELTHLEGFQLHTRDNRREAFAATPNIRCVIVGTDLKHIEGQLHILFWHIVAVCLLVLAGAIFVGWILSGIIVEPFRWMLRATNRIAEGELQTRIPEVSSLGETGELARALNHTFECLENSFEAQRRFTADAAHELRSPITALLLHVRRAARKPHTFDEYQAIFKNCERNVLHLQQLTTDLLDLAMLNAQSVLPKKENCDISSSVKMALDLLRFTIDENQVQIQTQLETTYSRSDKGGLIRAITNLVNNSILHSEKGVCINLTARTVEGACIITIQDNGPGIPADQLETVFNRFSRGEKSRADGTEGSGLGLAITKAIIEQQGGTIRITSEVGKGTLAHISLPCCNPV